jgi:hypothetical protein
MKGFPEGLKGGAEFLGQRVGLHHREAAAAESGDAASSGPPAP